MKLKRIFTKRIVFIPILILVLLILVTRAYSGVPPKTEFTVYKGIVLRAATLPPVTWVVSVPPSFAKMKDAGINIIQIPVYYSVDDEGNFELFPMSKELTMMNIQTAHRNGLRVFLSTFFMPRETGPVGAEISSYILRDTDFLERCNQEIVKWAEVAEKYNVELFSPLIEPELQLGVTGPELVYEWAQDILPKVKEVYHGDVVWRGVFSHWLRFWLPPKGRWAEPELVADLTGYDYIGTSIFPGMELEEYPGHVDRLLDLTTRFAEKYAKGAMVTEFGLFPSGPGGGPAQPHIKTSEDIARVHEITFERAKDRVVGFFVEDTALVQYDASAEEVVREWYKERLP